MKKILSDPIFWIVVAFLIVVGLVWHIYNLNNEINIGGAAIEKKQIEKKIDSLETKRTETVSEYVEKSQITADRAAKLMQTLDHEKPIIIDTSYSAMCDYIATYRPDY